MGRAKTTLDKLREFKQKYYTNLLIRGAIFTIALTVSILLIFSYLEFFLHLNKTFRQLLFFSFVLVSVGSLYYFIIQPLIFLLNIKQQISDEAAAELVGKRISNINDKLLNTIQLFKFSKENTLAAASLHQRELDFQNVSFSTAINFNENTKFIKYLIIPVLFLAFILIAFPSTLFESTSRIIHFNKYYAIEAPFKFIIKNNELQAFKDEDFTVTLDLEGKAFPEVIYLNNKGRKYKMENVQNNTFSYTFKKLQADEDFFIEAAGYSSEDYKLEVVSRPTLFDLSVTLNYPAYLNKPSERINNAGNLTIPEGTQIKWNFNTTAADSVILNFNNERLPAIESEKGKFSIAKKVKDNSNIKINLKNEYSLNKEEITYQINVIKDEFPQIDINITADTILFNNLIIGGSANDDYGLTKLQLFYQVENKGKSVSNNYSKKNVRLSNNSSNQNFYVDWKLDSLNLNPGDKINYYLQIWDNDGVNGPKSAKSKLMIIQLPEVKDIKDQLAVGDKKTESGIDKALEATKSIQKDINALKEDLKVKKKSNWQDKKKLEELLEKKEKLQEDIKKLQEQNTSQNLQKEKFLNPDEKILDKLKQLEKLMNNLLDEETKKLYDELQKLLKDQNNEQLPDALEKINKKEMNLEKELERALEMFKSMQFEQKLDNMVKDLKDLKEQQDKLSKESLQKTNQDSLINKQEKLNEEFKEKEKDLEELKKMNQDLDNPSPMQDTKQEENEIKENQEKSLEDLKNNKNKKSSESQSKASDQMEKLAKKLSDMQNSMEMEAQEENIAHLRDILENLLTLSFDQEALMKDFKNVNQSDPRYVTLSQKQLKIKDDAKIIEDSLLSLAKRVYQIESFVTREVSSMNGYIDESLDNLKKRKPGIAASKQQFAMKSMNDLALLLNDVLKQMQQQMAEASASGKGKKSKGKNKKPSPSLGELQQKLNERINQLMKSGKTGRALSEELAELAAQQEMIREALQKLNNSLEGGEKPGGKAQSLLKEMEKAEEELVNKKINQQTIERQRDILTRLLESEKSQREREFDEKREATPAKQLENKNQDKYAEYLKIKEKEIEFIKTLPPSFNTYYKNQVNNYFKNLKK